MWENVSSLRSRVRNEFPRGWWRSARWWWSGLRELGVNCLAAIAVGVLVRSRLWQRADWKDLDFIEAHVPRNGCPPETVEEYRALRMESES